MIEQNRIKCPKCDTIIDVNDLITHQLEKEIKSKYEAELFMERQKVLDQIEVIQKEKNEFEQKKKRENELFQEKLDEKVKLERQLIEEKIKKKFSDEQAEQFQKLQEELNEKTKKISELNLAKAEIEKLKREKEEAKSLAELEAQKKLNELLNEEKFKIKRAAEEENELKLKELQKKLDDQKQLTEEMKRKQEQGSMQLQGEVQELAIEEWLEAQFPLDSIEEIKKGARGGDCIQLVNTREHQNCGKIYYESKRTKDFSASWIDKLKGDMREKDADIGVLVTEVMPVGMERMGMKDGIYICTYEEFKALSGILRETIVQVNNALGSQVNKGDKMQMLYDYLTSNGFRMSVEAIVEGFSAMKAGLETEKRSMHRIWKEREKQLEKVIYNTIEMHASIRGIAGNAIQAVKALELPDDIEQLDHEND
jgi:hypothetical protein